MNINCFVGGGGYNIFQIALRETLQQLVTKETNITHDEHKQKLTFSSDKTCIVLLVNYLPPTPQKI